MKFKAYTIFEVLISMVIMSIILLIVFVLFSSFSKQLRLISESNSKTTDFAIFKHTIKRDFYLAKSINFKYNTIIVKKNDSVNIAYSFNNNYLVRSLNNSSDTIPLYISSHKINTDEYSRLTKLEMEILIFNEPLPVILNKTYQNSLTNQDFNSDEN